MKTKRTFADINDDLNAIVSAMIDVTMHPDFNRNIKFNPMLIRQQLEPLIKQYKELREEKINYHKK